MPEFPTIAHLAVTVRDLEESAPWYERLFDSRPVLDEDTGPFRHVAWHLGGQILFLLSTSSLIPSRVQNLMNGRLAWTTSHSRGADRTAIEQWRDWIDIDI